MSNRIIKTFAAFNVVAAGILFVWFQAIPQQSNMSEIAQQVVDESTDLTVDFRLKLMTSFRDAWEQRAKRYTYWAIAAGIVIAANTVLFFWHLALISTDNVRPPDQRSQVTGDER